MKFEEQIKESVRHELEGRPTTMGAWERFARRVDRGRMQRFTMAGLAAAAVIAAAVIVVPRLGEEKTITPIETPTASTTPTASPSPTTTPTPAVPAQAVAVFYGNETTNDDDAIVVISTATGKVIRTLEKADPGRPSGSFTPDIALSPDRKTLYFVRTGENFGCDQTIMSVPVAGGQKRVVAQGHSPALSPDGRFLAYSGKGTGPNCDHHPLVVRELDSGDERRWTWAAEDPEDVYESGGAYGLSWAQDSKSLAFYRNVGDPQWETWVLDATQGRTLLDAKKVGREGEGWEDPVFLKDGSLALVHTVRSIHDLPGGRHRIINVSTTGDVRGVIVDPDADITGLAVDRTAGLFIFSSSKGIYTVDGDTAVRIASGSFYSVAW